MTKSLLISIVAIPALMVIWGLVQAAWRKTFPEFGKDSDVLACRRNGGGCGCMGVCKLEQFERNGKHRIDARKTFRE